MKTVTVLIQSFPNLPDPHFKIYQDSEYKICTKREDMTRPKLPRFEQLRAKHLFLLVDFPILHSNLYKAQENPWPGVLYMRTVPCEAGRPPLLPKKLTNLPIAKSQRLGDLWVEEILHFIPAPFSQAIFLIQRAVSNKGE